MNRTMLRANQRIDRLKLNNANTDDSYEGHGTFQFADESQ